MRRALLVFLLGALSACASDGDGNGTPTPTGTPPAFDIETKYGRDFINYANVTKTNDVPKLWIQADTLDGVTASGPLGDVLIIREEGDPTVGWIFIKEKRAGAWRSGNFFPNDPVFTTVADDVPAPENLDAECLNCHPTQDETLFTLPSLRRFVTTGVVEALSCGAPGNSPCPTGTYE